jgi:hypothetical protein
VVIGAGVDHAIDHRRRGVDGTTRGKAPGPGQGGDIGGVEDILVGVEPALAGVEAKERPMSWQHLERSRSGTTRALPGRRYCMPADTGPLRHLKSGGKRAGAAAGGLLDRRSIEGDRHRLTGSEATALDFDR